VSFRPCRPFATDLGPGAPRGTPGAEGVRGPAGNHTVAQKQLRVAQTLGQYIATMDLEPAKAIQYQALGRGPAEGEGGGGALCHASGGGIGSPYHSICHATHFFFLGAILRSRVPKGANFVPILISKQPDFIFCNKQVIAKKKLSHFKSRLIRKRKKSANQDSFGGF